MTLAEFNRKWCNYVQFGFPDGMYERYIQERFEVYEQGGFHTNNYVATTFWSVSFDGKPFEVVRRCTQEDAILEIMPAWVIRFKDGSETVAYIDNICNFENTTSFTPKPKQGKQR